ncbi:hypothetical protein C5E45_32885 [Nocardia nova]|uniref:Uncharacterized protein n=1 Tax=Nocardia nova TaxID=37330 RepID=A0A2S6ACS1_9NOCA|nr:hypothetical protein [Nocardia nova]PPJ31888.1 hypothetical protein C5E45_32885 [Nocardia nova]
MQIIADEKRKARKPHRCMTCGRTIDPGETYRHTRTVDGRDIWTWKECAHCGAMMTILRLWDWAEDDGFNPDWINGFEPTTIAEARIFIGWRRKWRRKDGTLREVPEVVGRA